MRALIFCLLSMVGVCYAGTSAEQLEKECGGGAAKSCFKLGKMYYLGEKKMFIAPDTDKAKELYLKSCELGSNRACDELISRFYNNSESKEIQKQLCDKGVMKACHEVGQHEKACNGGYAEGCAAIAREYEDKDLRKAKELYDKAIAIYKQACDKGDFQSCQDLGDEYLFDNYGFYGKNEKQTEIYYDKACNQTTDDGAVCWHVGYYYYKYLGNNKKAKAAFERSCDLGYADGCDGYNAL